MGVKFQGNFTIGTYFRTKVSNIMSRVNCQSNSLKSRYTIVRGSVFAFGLLALTNQGRGFAVGWVIVGLLFIGSALGRVRKRRKAGTAEEMAEAKSEMLVALIPDFLPPVEPVPRSFPGFLSCQCLAFSAAENLAYTSLG